MAYSVDESSCKDSGEQVTESVALLEHTGDETSSFLRAVFERYGKWM